MIKVISQEEAKESLKIICGNCKHSLSHHLFWNPEKVRLELLNCGECWCEKFIAGGKKA